MVAAAISVYMHMWVFRSKMAKTNLHLKKCLKYPLRRPAAARIICSRFTACTAPAALQSAIGPPQGSWAGFWTPGAISA